MQRTIIFLLSILLIISACKEKEPTSPEDETPQEKIYEASIGTEGGELKTDNCIISIPSGAFTSTNDLKLAINEDDKPYEGSAVSELFKIYGLPDIILKPIRIAIKYQESLLNDSFIAIGEEVAVKSLGDIATTYCLLEAVDSAGYLVAKIDIPESYNTMGSLLKSNDGIENWIKIVGVSNLYLVQSTEKHFMIIGEASKTSKLQLELVGSNCEKAYNIFLNKGFNYNERKSWPIPIFLKEIVDETGGYIYGYYTKSKFFDSHGYIIINSGLFSDPDELLITIGHEFLHLVQDLYDPRLWGTKMYDFGNHLWLDEATAVYSEEFFVNNPGEYVSAAFKEREFSPFFGFHKEGKGAAEHGYGMAPVIKYLTNKFLFSNLAHLYNDVWLGKHPIESIIYNANETTDWVAPFFRDYIEGKVYNVQSKYWINLKLDEKYTFNINSKDSTLKIYDLWYPDLSAWIFKVLLNYPDISQSSSINFNLTSIVDEESEISVYKYNSNNELVFLNNSITQVTITGIKELTSQGWNLLGVLTNSSAYKPYTEKTNITLEIKKTEKPIVTGCLIQTGNIVANVIMDYSNGSTTSEEGWYSDDFFSHTDEPTTITIFENNELSTSFDYTSSDGLYYSGVSNVKFNEEFTKIISFSVNSEIQYEPDKYYGYIKQSSLSGHDIPIDPNNMNNIWFKIKGNETCDKIDQMSYQWITTGYTETKEIKNCNEDSYIEILVGIE